MPILCWSGKCEFLCRSMNVFDLALGLDYLDEVMAFISPSLNQVYTWDPKGHCVVPTIRVPQVIGQLFAMQIVKGFKRGEATFLAVVTKIKEDKTILLNL